MKTSTVLTGVGAFGTVTAMILFIFGIWFDGRFAGTGMIILVPSLACFVIASLQANGGN